jgi:hypothetical protein
VDRLFMEELLMKYVVSTFIALALASLAAGPTAAAEGTKSTKTAVQVESLTEIHQTNSFVPILSASIHIPEQKDIHVDVSAECGLATDTTVKSKGKHSDDGTSADSATAEAAVMIRVRVFDQNGVEVPDVVKPSRAVTFCKRTQTLSAKLQGFIATSGCFDADGNFRDDLAECTLYTEEIGLMLDTLQANAFNYLVENLNQGVYTVVAEAEIHTCSSDPAANCATTGENGSSFSSTAMLGMRSMVLDEIHIDNDTQ